MELPSQILLILGSNGPCAVQFRRLETRVPVGLVGPLVLQRLSLIGSVSALMAPNSPESLQLSLSHAAKTAGLGAMEGTTTRLFSTGRGMVLLQETCTGILIPVNLTPSLHVLTMSLLQKNTLNAHLLIIRPLSAQTSVLVSTVLLLPRTSTMVPTFTPLRVPLTSKRK